MNFSAQCPVLKNKLGNDGFLEFSDTFDSAKREGEKELLDTATDRFERRLGAETSALRLEISAVRLEIAGVRLEIASSHRSMLRWMFLFWVAQLGTTLSVVKMLVER